MPRSQAISPLLLLVALTACGGGGGGSIACGIAALTGPLVAKEAFAKGNSLLTPPDSVPTSLPLRVVAGVAIRGHVASVDSLGWHISTPDVVTTDAPLGYGVLIVGRQGQALGALIFEGAVIPGAALLGDLTIRDTVLPLLGVRIDPKQIEDPKCPVFPDSTR